MMGTAFRFMIRTPRETVLDTPATAVRVLTHSGHVGIRMHMDDVLGDYLTGTFSSLYAVSARFDGVGAFTARTTRILPVASTQSVQRLAATPYATARHLAEAAVREYLYSTLYELLLDALAAEHGMRLVEEWLDTRMNDLQRQLASARRESSTQEVLDVAGAARQRRRRLVA